MTPITRQDILAHQAVVPWAAQYQVEQDLLLCRTTKSPTPVDPAAIIASFEHYLKQEGTKAGRAEFIGILDDHLKDQGFCSDMQPLLRTGITYEPQAAGKYIKAHLLNRLPL